MNGNSFPLSIKTALRNKVCFKIKKKEGERYEVDSYSKHSQDKALWGEMKIILKKIMSLKFFCPVYATQPSLLITYL